MTSNSRPNAVKVIRSGTNFFTLLQLDSKYKFGYGFIHSNMTEERFALELTEKVPALLAYWDKNEVCRFANKATLDWYGLTREEAVGKITLEKFLADSYEKVRPKIQGVLQGKEQVFERTYTMPDGTSKYGTATYTPHYQDGEVVGFFVHVSDITHVEQQERRRDRVKEDSKRDLVRSVIETQEAERNVMAVQLRDNINQILSSCKLMLESAASHENPSQQISKSYELIERAIQQVKMLTVDLHPSPVLDLGFRDGMQEYISRFIQTQELPVYFNCSDTANDAMPDNIRVPAFRMLQDSLGMLDKYSNATHLEVDVDRTTTDYLIIIRHDDRDFDFTFKCKEWENIRNRLEYLNGKMNALKTDWESHGVQFSFPATSSFSSAPQAIH